MAKRKATRRRRKRGGRPPAPSLAVPPTRPAVPAAAIATHRAPEPARERSITRFTTRDYTYVRRELQRIVLLAAAILLTIVVLSFFLP